MTENGNGAGGDPRKAKERRFESGPGFVRAKNCPDCGHTRCGEDCVCDCDAAHAEHEAAWRASRMEEQAARISELEAELAERDETLRALGKRLHIELTTRGHAFDWDDQDSLINAIRHVITDRDSARERVRELEAELVQIRASSLVVTGEPRD